MVLYLNYKHYHWQTFGTHFRDLHKLFDDFAEEVLETIDPLAERVRMIGHMLPAHPLEAADSASVTPAAPHSTMREMLEEADCNALVVIQDMRQGAKHADEHDDPVPLRHVLEVRADPREARMVGPRHAPAG